jgi:hypothetical protein
VSLCNLLTEDDDHWLEEEGDGEEMDLGMLDVCEKYGGKGEMGGGGSWR